MNPHTSKKRIDRAVSLSKPPGLQAILGGSVTSHSEPFHTELTPAEVPFRYQKKKRKKVCDRPDLEYIVPKKRRVENSHIQINSSGYGSTAVGGSLTIFSPGSG